MHMIPVVVVVAVKELHLSDSHTYHTLVSADWNNHTDHEVCCLLHCLLLLAVKFAM